MVIIRNFEAPEKALAAIVGRGHFNCQQNWGNFGAKSRLLIGTLGNSVKNVNNYNGPTPNFVLQFLWASILKS